MAENVDGAVGRWMWHRGVPRVVGGDILLPADASEPYEVYEAAFWGELPFSLARLIAINTKGEEALDIRAVKRFVGDYGMLWSGPVAMGTGGCSESLEDWRRAAVSMRGAISLYETRRKAVKRFESYQRDCLTMAALRPDLTKVRQALKRLDGSDAPDSDAWKDPGPLLMHAGDRLVTLINDGRVDCRRYLVASYRLPKAGLRTAALDEFVYSNHFSTLLAAAYDRLSQRVARKVKAKGCLGCGGPFVPEHGNQTYCEPRCYEKIEGRVRRGVPVNRALMEEYADRF